MSVLTRIVVRHRSYGHVRFELPGEWPGSDQAGRLVGGLRRIGGVYRVDWYPSTGKLSIRFFEQVLDFKDLSRRFADMVAALAPASPSEAALEALPGVGGSGLSGWAKAKYAELEETLQAAKIMAERLRERVASGRADSNQVLDFLTDILVLYLLKRYWRTVLGSWVVRPWQHKYEWAALSYLLFLLVRSRLSTRYQVS